MEKRDGEPARPAAPFAPAATPSPEAACGWKAKQIDLGFWEVATCCFVPPKRQRSRPILICGCDCPSIRWANGEQRPEGSFLAQAQVAAWAQGRAARCCRLGRTPALLGRGK
jgi:hypothetical protein